MSAPEEPSGSRKTLNDFDTRLRDLEKRAEATGTLRRKVETKPNTALGSALRLSTEFLAAIAVGGVLGWYLDDWLGTKPALFLTMMGLGIAAGFFGVFRSARQMQAEDAEKAKSAPAMPVADVDED